uniref:Uncharacterized protein n=1 Tax=Anguilla anguilla TaxID=7936 RepID=A0A0E9UMX5_ANGAN
MAFGTCILKFREKTTSPFPNSSCFSANRAYMISPACEKRSNDLNAMTHIFSREKHRT